MTDHGHDLPDAVRQQFVFLVRDHGFNFVTEEAHFVRLESQTLGAEVTYHRGEVEVTVFRLGREEPWERWGYEGMVGRASLPRVLEIAGEKLLADDAVLRGDADYFDRLAQENRRLDEAWTAYYSGTGPRPATGRLP